MRRFGVLWGRVTLIFSAICTFALLLLGLFTTTDFFGVQADEKSYLQVKSTNFTVEQTVTERVYFKITLKSDVDMPHTATDYLNYGLEADGETFSLYNGKGEELTLNGVGPGGSSDTLIFTIKIKDKQIELENAKDLNKIVINPGAKLVAPNPTVYAGIEFADGLTLVKDDEGEWIVEETQAEEENNQVELNATDLELAWNGDSGLLEATLALPFTRDADVSYTSTLDVRLNDALETVTAVQYAGESKIRLLFENYVAPADNEIPRIRIQGGNLTDLEGRTIVNVLGETTFYEYVDKTWSTEKYVQLKETTLGVTTERKLGVLDTHVFMRPQVETNKLYAGWTFQGELVQAGESVAIASYTKRTIETEAVFLSYALIEGASIRFDKTGDCSGIRFGAKLSTEDFSAFKEYIQGVGIIIMPSDLLGAEEFTLENYGAVEQAKNFFVTSKEILSDGEYFTLYAVLAKVLEANYNRALCARAYVLTKNGDYIWTSNVEKRSVYQVATAIMNEYKQKGNLEDWQTSVVETYLNGVANVTYENGETTVVSSALSPVITEAKTEENGNYVTLKLTTQKTSFSAITYNGKRVKNASQSYADGILTITFDKTQAKA